MKKNGLIKKLQRIHLKRSITALFFAFIAFTTFSIPIISIISSIIAIILAIIAFYDKKVLSIIIIIIALSASGFSIYKYITRPKKLIDPNLGKNVVLGIWKSDTVSYEFQDDRKYIQYLGQELTDNYCVGTYAYEYSYSNKDGKIIQSDYDYTYYYVVVDPDYCIINGIKDLSQELIKSKGLVFGYGNNNKNKAVIVNTNTEKFIILNKKSN